MLFVSSLNVCMLQNREFASESPITPVLLPEHGTLDMIITAFAGAMSALNHDSPRDSPSDLAAEVSRRSDSDAT